MPVFRAVNAGSTPLTNAERRVLDVVTDGLSDADIAARLGLSRRTEQSQVASAQRKLGAVNRHDATRRNADWVW